MAILRSLMSAAILSVRSSNTKVVYP